MKDKRILLILAALLLLSGCKKQPEPTEPAQTEVLAAEETTPQVEYATVEANGTPVILDVLSRGDTVDLAGDFDAIHYVVKRENGYGLVEKNLVRLEEKAPYTAWTGYAYRGAKLYDNYRLAGDPVQTLDADAQVQVLEDLSGCFLVEYNGISGYMKRETIARNSVSGQKTPAGGDARESEAGQDGGAITLLSTVAPQEGAVSGKATVLADDTQVILGYFDRGDRIPVIQQAAEEGFLTVCLDGLYAWVSDACVQTADENAYVAWDGKTVGIVSVYEDFWMQGSPIGRLNGNVTVRILCELENCYLVEAEGLTGYMAKADVTDIPEETTPPAADPTKPAATEPTVATEPTKPEEDPRQETKPAKPEKPTKPTETPTVPTDPTEVPTEPTVAPTEPTEAATEPTEAPEWTPPIL